MIYPTLVKNEPQATGIIDACPLAPFCGKDSAHHGVFDSAKPIDAAIRSGCNVPTQCSIQTRSNQSPIAR